MYWFRWIAVTVVSIVLYGWQTPAVLAVNWGDCVVQPGQVSIAPGSTTATATISAVDTAHAFIMANSSGTVNVSVTANRFVTAQLTNSTTATFTRTGTTGTLYIQYHVVSCPSDAFTVQRGNVTITNGQSLATANLSTTVDLTQSFVIVSNRSNASAQLDSNALITGFISDPTTITVQRSGNYPNNAVVHYQVIEFSDSSNVQVQTTEVTVAPGEIFNHALLSNEVVQDRTWILCNWDATDNGSQQTSIACSWDDSGAVRADRATAGAYTNRVRFYAITWPKDTVTIASGTQLVNTTTADNTLSTVDITLPNRTAYTGLSFPFVTNIVLETGTIYPRHRWLYSILNNATLRTQYWRSDAAGNSDQTTQYWQIINFPPPYQPQGWGWIGGSPDGFNGAALISFSCENLTDALGTNCGDGTGGTRHDYGVVLEHGGCNENCEFSGQAWVGVYDTNDSAVVPLGMIDFDPDITDAPIGDDTATANEDEGADARWNELTGEVYGWARFRALRDYENSLGGGQHDWGWIRLRGKVNGAGTEYGVRFDAASQQFSGWAWNDNGSTPAGVEVDGSGFGFVRFDLDNFGTVNQAWLRTTQGNVYSGDGISATTAAPTGKQNATYMIYTAGDTDAVTNFTATAGSVSSHDFGDVPTDAAGTNVYRGTLGSIHVDALIEEAQRNGTAQTGNCTDSLLLGHTNPLGGGVYYCSGNLTINSNKTFYNATGNGNGSGTIVVGGDLFINDSINYAPQNNLDRSIGNLASVAWIVKGRVEIAPTVRQLAGAFIVLGDQNPATTGVYDVETGGSTLPLQVYGLMMARSFAFERRSLGPTTSSEPSEDIRYDGRAFANPPPGLVDFGENLPNFAD